MRNFSKIIVITVIIGQLFSSCTTKQEKAPLETFYLVTRLGNDTLAVEKITTYSDSITATVLLRSPQLRIISFGYATTPGRQALRAVYQNPVADELVNTENAVWENDSLQIALRSGEIEKSIPAEKNILPFIDMVHWPFELMTRNIASLDINQAVNQQVWSGTNTFKFETMQLNEDSVVITHPSRGAMGVTVGEGGKIIKLDASQTTRKLIVTRLANLDFDRVLESFIKAEQAGKGIGALSGTGKLNKTVQGVSYEINYGTPSKRGREIWGALVPYGERWRTGANRATHFKTDKNIQINELKIPAGEYTLFTIPYEETCELIINKQTGQNGQTYDPALDLGRVELMAKPLPAPVEVFTIDIIERENNVYLSLQWDMKSYEVLIKK